MTFRPDAEGTRIVPVLIFVVVVVRVRCRVTVLVREGAVLCLLILFDGFETLLLL